MSNISQSVAEFKTNTVPQYKIDRPIWEQNDFYELYPPSTPLHTEKSSRIKQFLTSMCLRNRSISTIITESVPFLSILRSFYKLSYLPYDVVAGLTMFIMHIPQGLAYGHLAGLRPINGLYTSFFPPLIYFFLGTSRQLSVGTFSIISLMVSGPVYRLTRATTSVDGTHSIGSVGNESDRNSTGTSITDVCDSIFAERLQVAIATGLIAGMILLICAVFRLGQMTTYLSEPMVSGFTCGAAFTVFIGQVVVGLGVNIHQSVGVGKLAKTVVEIVWHYKTIHVPTMIMTLSLIFVLWIFKVYINPRVMKKIRFPIPMEFISIVVAGLISYNINIWKHWGVRIIGNVPKGIPPFTPPNPGKYFTAVWGDAVALAVVGYMSSASLSKMFATLHKYRVDFNQEMISLGVVNVIGSFFQCHFATGSISRSIVVVDLGMRSQLASLFSTISMFIVLLWLTPLFESVPRCALSAIIIIGLKGTLQQITCLRDLWRMSRYDFVVWSVTFWSVLLLDIVWGLGMGIICSMFLVIYRTQRTTGKLLGQIPNTDIYVDLVSHTDAVKLPHISIFQFQSNVYFANAERFQDELYAAILPPQKHCGIQLADMPHSVIIDCGYWSYIDSVGAQTLKACVTQCHSVGFDTYLANVCDDVFGVLKKVKLEDEPSCGTFFLTTHDAVLACQPPHQIANGC